MAQLGRRVLRVPLDEGDIPVAEQNQVADHRHRAFIVVDAYRGVGLARPRGRHRHGGHLQFGKQFEHRRGVAQRRREQYPVHPGCDEIVDGGAPAALASALLENQLGPAGTAFVHGADQEGAQEGRARITVEQANAQAAHARGARGHVDFIFQLRDGGVHAGARFIADAFAAIDDARHCHRRHPGQTGYVIHRRIGLGLVQFITHRWHRGLFLLTIPLLDRIYKELMPFKPWYACTVSIC